MNNNFKHGKILWFDGQDGMILCIETKKQYYFHVSSLPIVFNNLKGYPVKFSLYTNLYMNQVDSVKFYNKQSELPENCKAYTWGVAWNNLCNLVESPEHKQFIA